MKRLHPGGGVEQEGGGDWERPGEMGSAGKYSLISQSPHLSSTWCTEELWEMDVAVGNVRLKTLYRLGLWPILLLSQIIYFPRQQCRSFSYFYGPQSKKKTWQLSRTVHRSSKSRVHWELQGPCACVRRSSQELAETENPQ